MSRFYGTLKGASKTTATRRGHTELVTHAAGWKGAIRVTIVADGDTDRFMVDLVPWKGSPGTGRLLATGVLDSSIEPVGVAIAEAVKALDGGV